MIELICEGCGESYQGQHNQRFCTPNCKKIVTNNNRWLKEKKVKKVNAKQRMNFGRI